MVDGLDRQDHFFLNEEDVCYYYGEYTARKGFGYSETNQTISNLKKSVAKKSEYEYKYKEQAIIKIAKLLASSIKNGNEFTFVPVPPSKARDHDLYDDRLCQILKHYDYLTGSIDWREIVCQQTSLVASHERQDRPTPEQLANNYVVDQEKLAGVKNNILIFDDMLTTGSHYKAMQSTLSKFAPHTKIMGLFIARRVPNADDLF
ncbi:conserved hypothetical protein [Teredinibacter turnerae T7901]|uniref:ComF family protein n=2 Tax=Teredinibacter turnerae TaxID=2426 RepID=C5BUI9_TERTT|nr:conserved hypothetical protein [Teredinibacter turnerae T7901]